MSYARVRVVSRTKRRRPQGHRRFAPLGDSYNTITMSDGTVVDCSSDTLSSLPVDQQAACALNSITNSDAGYAACAAQADQAVAPIDQMRTQVRDTWNPSGPNFATADLRKIIQQAMVVESAARSAIDNAKSNAPSTQQDLLDQMRSNLDDIGARATAYLQAANAADQQNTAVAAPGLKQFVLDTYTAASTATHAAQVVMCQLPTWIIVLQAVITACQAFSNVVIGIASVALALGKKAVAAVEGGLDAIATIEKILPWAAVGLAAWWLFLRENKRTRTA